MEELYQACCELPCDLGKVRHLLETNSYTPTQLMQTSIQFSDDECWAKEENLSTGNERESQKGELHVQHLYDLLKLFLEFGLDPNEIADDENIMSSLCYLYSPEAPKCMYLLLEHGGNPNLMLEDFSICGWQSVRVDFGIGEYGPDAYNEQIYTWFVMLGYGGRATNGETLVEMKHGHEVEELRMYEQISYTIEHLPDGKWVMHIIRKDTGEEIASF